MRYLRGYQIFVVINISENKSGLEKNKEQYHYVEALVMIIDMIFVIFYSR